MANSKLLKEAIADAKAVKETALANAKLALEEAFTPRLQSILSQKMRAEAEMEDDDAEKVDEELSTSGIGTGDSNGEKPGKQPTLDADTDVESGVVKTSSGKPETAATGYTKTKDISEGEEMEDEKDKEIAELRARLAELEGDESSEDDEMGAEGDDMGMDSDEDGEDYEITGDEDEDTEEDDMDLESIIRELEAQLGDEEEEKEMETEGDDEGDGDAASASAEDTAYQKKAPEQAMDEAEEDDKEKEDVIDLEEILREMEADMKDDESKNEAEEEDKDSTKAELKEAYKTIKSLQKTINEVNLLNAKLLFANKLFRAHNMTNEQKVKVIETLDRTKSVREVKLVYSTLAENLKSTPTKSNVAKKSITEGLASKVVKSTKPAAVAQKQVIAESSNFADRFKKLAGIIK